MYRGRYVPCNGETGQSVKGIRKSARLSAGCMGRSRACREVCELLGEVVFPDTKKNLQLRAESGKRRDRRQIPACKAGERTGYDAIHDTVHEWQRMKRDMKRL